MTTESKEVQQAKQRKRLALQKKYAQRITIARQAREAFLQKDYINATQKYHEYLAILAELNEVSDIYQLAPKMFDSKRQITEMLLISHVYWELARINEMTPKLQQNFSKSLNQFVKFTINQPYQVLNAEMLRKYIKKNKRITPQLSLLNDAYQQIFVQSKKCYIATMCFGGNHETTNALREFKSVIIDYKIGQSFVAFYYKYSSSLVKNCETRPWLTSYINFFSKPILITIVKVLRMSKII